MVIFKKIAAQGKYQDDNAIYDLINYICRPDKTPSHIIGGIGVDFQNIADSMVAVSMKFRKFNRLRLHHFILTFNPEDIYIKDMLPKIAEEICALWGAEFQIVYALHEDTDHPHIHFVWNNVSYIDGHKCHFGITEYNRTIGYIKHILGNYSLYPVIPVKYIPDNLYPHE